MVVAITADSPLSRLFWRALDALDYWLTEATLRAADLVCGPQPETAADRQRSLD